LYRVLVMGCSGSGKSTVARELSKITGLPAVHLDQHYWRPDRTEPDKALWSAEIASLVAQPRWIMDGNYSSTLADRLSRADTVVFLDMPTALCLWRVLCRTLRHIGCTRDDMAKGCLARFDWPFLKYVSAIGVTADRKCGRPLMASQARWSFWGAHPPSLAILPE